MKKFSIDVLEEAPFTAVLQFIAQQVIFLRFIHLILV